MENENNKPELNIYEWYIDRQGDNCFLIGISNQYAEGKPVRISKLLSVDFVTGFAETCNTMYRLKKGSFKRKKVIFQGFE
jgi:hypothetical protein